MGLQQINEKELKGVPIDLKLRFQFYWACFNGYSFCLLFSKKAEVHASQECLNLSIRLEKIVKTPAVFLFEHLQNIERDRLIKRGVYFIVSNKYAYLPFLVINTRGTSEQKIKDITFSAQYILLYHLQKGNLNGATIQEIEDKTPYSYITITRAVKTLEDLQLCQTETDKKKVKHLIFDKSGEELWNKALSTLKSPVQHYYYCDEISIDAHLTHSNITALAFYSHLNPDEIPTYALDKTTFKTYEQKQIFKGLNKSEGNIRLEVWHYPPLQEENADRLSLYLSLKDEKDPRVEKELELMIKKLW